MSATKADSSDSATYVGHTDPVVWHRIVVLELAQRCIVTRACNIAGISRETFYQHYKADAEFRAQVDDAKERGTDRLEDKLIDRALGENGEDVSDRCLLAALAAHRPHKYRPKWEVSGPGGKAIQVNAQAQVLHADLKTLMADPDAAAALKVLAEREAALLTRPVEAELPTRRKPNEKGDESR